MTEDKKSELKRLIIYLAFSFGIAWIMFFVFMPEGKTWDELGQLKQSFIALGMLAPVIAHVITRLITKEGFAMTGEGSMMLGISFKNRKWIFYLLAILLPWIYTELGNAVTILLCPEIYDPKYYISLAIEKRLLLLLPIAGMVSGVIGSFAAFGEESGWRGYMMQKLTKLFEGKPTGKLWAFIIGGVIWGLWHAPLTCIGHNFGTEYPGFPYLGILMMCIFCTLMGIILTFVTEKSGSVWPAAIMHAVNNTNPSILNGYIDYEKVSGLKGMLLPSVGRMIVMVLIIGMLVIATGRKHNTGVKEKSQTV